MHIIDINELYTELQNDSVYFQFLKKDGTMRSVTGTLKKTLIPEKMRPKDPSYIDASLGPKNLKFFDLDKNEWRSISKNTTLVTILE